MGYYCSDTRQLICADQEGCGVKVTLGSCIDYICNEQQVQRALARLKTSHTNECKFTKKQFPTVIKAGEFAREGLVSRKSLYLYAREIYNSNLDSLD